jgi:formate dehydrogenase subunit delta
MQKSDTLVRMANQIAKFFAVQGEERAVAGIADHIKKFWEPRMKAAIFAHVDAGGAGLDPLALEALRTLQAGGKPKGSPQTPPLVQKSAKAKGDRNGKAAAE